MWRKGNFLQCWWECKLAQPLWKMVWRFLRKLKIELPYEPAVALLCIYPPKMKTLIWKDTWTSMFIAALFTIAKIWKQPKCPSADKWIKEMWYVHVYTHTQTYTHKGILLSHKKKDILPFAATWMDLEGIMLSEINQTEKDKYCMISFICEI